MILFGKKWLKMIVSFNLYIIVYVLVDVINKVFLGRIIIFLDLFYDREDMFFSLMRFYVFIVINIILVCWRFNFNV